MRGVVERREVVPRGGMLAVPARDVLVERGAVERIAEHLLQGEVAERRLAVRVVAGGVRRDDREVGDLAALYGTELAAALVGAPSSAFLADGSEIAVHLPSRVGK